MMDTVILGGWDRLFAMHRERGCRSRSPFPLPLGGASHLQELALRSSLAEFCRLCQDGGYEEDAWLACAICGVNGVAGKSRAAHVGTGTKAQMRAVDQLKSSIKKVLTSDVAMDRTPEAAVKELASRYITYTGEEVPKMQTLSVDQVTPALPPPSHGGSIQAVDLVCPGTRRFLEQPEDSLISGVEVDKKGLQARVHIVPEDRQALASLLVERNVCVWVPDSEVLKIDGCRVLNGLFGVGKGKFLEDGREIQRVIMNLIPSNSVMAQAKGATSGLPSITQYLSMVLDGNEEIQLFQSDMSSAFYLFAIPRSWSPYLCFNLQMEGREIGMNPSKKYFLGCRVIPMGWSSAVSIMQEIADRLTTIGRLPEDHKVRRDCPLPPWMVESLRCQSKTGSSWFHVYLDNFCAMGKTNAMTSGEEAVRLHRLVEESWQASGVLSSSGKRVAGAMRAVELGAEVNGIEGTLGPSSERLIKLIQSTLSVISRGKLNRKWIQVLAGRWIHILAFRRPGMVVFNRLWMFVSKNKAGRKLEMLVRGELLHCCLISPLLRGDLRAKVSSVTTASDASESGGAVGFATELTAEGAAFATVDKEIHGMVPRVPIMVLSLFNGMGCAFRCYDLVGINPEVAIAFEISPEGNRVTSRRWPNVVIEKDVRTLSEEMVKSWKYLYPFIESIHLWAGFPCVDLSSVKFGRKNLRGSESSLLFEVVRILKLLRSVYGFEFDIKYFAENVASMDVEAEQEISNIFGRKPFRLDSADVVPIHRPRFCWSNVKISYIHGIKLGEISMDRSDL